MNSLPNFKTSRKSGSIDNRVQRVNLSVDASLELSMRLLKTRGYQTTLFGERRLLCVKRSRQKNHVLSLEILLEAFSRYETKITIGAKSCEGSLPWESTEETAEEVAELAQLLVRQSTAQTRQPAAFPLNALQVCIA
jgi:hypothetical protein